MWNINLTKADKRPYDYEAFVEVAKLEEPVEA